MTQREAKGGRKCLEHEEKLENARERRKLEKEQGRGGKREGRLGGGACPGDGAYPGRDVTGVGVSRGVACPGWAERFPTLPAVLCSAEL